MHGGVRCSEAQAPRLHSRAGRIAEGFGHLWRVRGLNGRFVPQLQSRDTACTVLYDGLDTCSIDCPTEDERVWHTNHPTYSVSTVARR